MPAWKGLQVIAAHVDDDDDNDREVESDDDDDDEDAVLWLNLLGSN